MKGLFEMPVAMMNVGSKHRIKSVGGNDTIRKHLGDMGFVEGAEVEIVTESAGNYILGIHGTRVALNHDLAMRILV